MLIKSGASIDSLGNVNFSCDAGTCCFWLKPKKAIEFLSDPFVRYEHGAFLTLSNNKSHFNFALT